MTDRVAIKRVFYHFIVVVTFLGLFLGLPSAYADQQLITDNNQREFYSLRSTVTTTGPQYSFQITSPNISVVRVFPLQQPSRIVIDVQNSEPLKLNELDLMGNAFVQNIRIGNFQGNTRYVIDLKTARVPHFEWTQTKDAFRLLLTAGNSRLFVPADEPAVARAMLRPDSPPPARVMEPRAVSIEPAPRNRPQPELPKPPALSPKSKSEKKLYTGSTTTPSEITLALLERKDGPPPALPDKNIRSQTASTLSSAPEIRSKATSLEPSTQPLVQAEKVVPPAPPRPLNGQVLTAIQFESSSQGPVVRLDLRQEPAYTLKKSGAKEYLLRVNNATVAKQSLLLPQFPPQDFDGLTMIMAEQAGPDLNIFVGVDRDTKLNIARKASSLEIRVRD
ncbi:MAG: AMIN domain-containing protein [Bdellovibrionales bacterium]|nr:AMIN domain-containing protein [Bdellovibrionales bacterium]